MPGLTMQRPPLSPRDQIRHALQAPIASPKYCVLYMSDRKERRTPWFYRESHARSALSVIERKHGPALIYVD